MSEYAGLEAIASSAKTLRMMTAEFETVSLENRYAGQSVFLLCGGPSLTDNDLSLLDQRGIVTMAVNNAWAIHRPTLWTHADPPSSFHHVGWNDPGITKFVPIPYADAEIMEKRDDAFIHSSKTTRDAPNVWFYPRRLGFDPDTFFDEPAVCWGNGEKMVDSLGLRGQRSCMYAALRLLVYLGFHRVYIVGADFRMTEDRGYAFEQDRDARLVKGNNSAYEIMNQRFNSLNSALAERGVQVFNCAEGSGLTAFPFKPFSEAVEAATEAFTGQIDTARWYDKKTGHARPLAERRSEEVRKYQRIYEDDQKWYGQKIHAEPGYPFIFEEIKPTSILDVGCGRNGFARECRMRGIPAMGLDFACPDADVLAAAHDIPSPDNSFDLVTAFDFLEHLLPDELSETLREMARVGRRYMVRIAHFPHSLRGYGTLHHIVQPEGWWTRKLREAGWTVNKHGEFLYGDLPDVGDGSKQYRGFAERIGVAARDFVADHED